MQIIQQIILTAAEIFQRIIGQDENTFWLRLVIFNVVFFAIIFLFYKIIRSLIRIIRGKKKLPDPRTEKGEKARSFLSEVTDKVNIRTKLGHRDVDIVDTATDHYLENKSEKLTAWVEEADTPDTDADSITG